MTGGDSDKRSSDVRVALITTAGVVVAALIGLVGAVVTAHNPAVSRALGGSGRQEPAEPAQPLESETPPVPSVTPTTVTPGGDTGTVGPAYLLDMNWEDFTNTGPQRMLTGLATMKGKKYRRSFITGRCYVDEVVVQLTPGQAYTRLVGVVGYQDDDPQKKAQKVEIATTDSDPNSGGTWNLLDTLNVSSKPSLVAYEETLPAGTVAVRLSTAGLGCAPEIVWGDPRVS